MGTYKIGEPFIMADSPGRSDKMIMYMYADAFTKCDCGKDIVLTQRVFGNNTYKGTCSCGKKTELLNGKFKCE